MKQTKLLDDLIHQGAQFWVENGHLVVRARKGLLDDKLRSSIAQRKTELIQAVQEQRCKLQGNGHPVKSQLLMLKPDAAHRCEAFPLTDIQQVYWLGRNPTFELGGVGIHVYEEIQAVDLDLERLNRAWQRVIDRHDMLRAIVLPDGRQQVLKQASYNFELLDLRVGNADQQASALASTREQLSHRVYAPEIWPWFKIRACRLSDRHTRLFISIDAMHVDMGSFAIVFRDWLHYYAKPDAQLHPLEISFRDYALALEDIRQTEIYRGSLIYWQAKAKELPPAPELPQITTASDLSNHKFLRTRGRLDKERWRRLKNRAAAANLTPSGLALAVYAEVLAAWSKDLRFTINVTIFNRLPLHPRINDIVGDFTSMILLGVDCSAAESFETRARRIQEHFLEGIEHRYVSGVQVLRDVSRVQHGVGGHAVMPVVFTSTLNLDTQGLLPLAKLGERVFNLMQTPQVSLDLQVSEEGEELVFNWDAVEALFLPKVVDEMFGAYCSLLQRLADEEEVWHKPERDLVSPAQLERRALVNATSAPVPDETLYSLFAGQALQQPRQPAIVFQGRTMTYEELYQRSNQIGRRLVELGAAPDKPVAVVIEKCCEQVAAALGVMQSGAAYLPIDAKVPAERLRYFLNDSEIRLALTTTSLDESLSWPEGVKRICVDQNNSDALDQAPLPIVQQPKNLAYVMYTSGSTGSPKGVMIEQRSVVNRILDLNERFNIGVGDRVLALTELHHDLSVYDLFGTLAAGATLVMPDAAKARSPSHWARLISEEQVTIWNSVPAFMEMLVGHLMSNSSRLATRSAALRLVLLAGDWIPVTLPKRIEALFKGVEIVSLGGPTETTIWDICFPINVVDPKWKSIPYGRPMRNAKYFILNEARQPCPDWVAGELCIGGVGLARGYWQDEEKTRSAFFQHPRTQERLYLSGDLGRYRPDGNIEFLGRKDFQMKVGGYRIEAGEIEETIKSHPQIDAAVVTALGRNGSGKKIVAYVVPKTTSRILASQGASNGQSRQGKTLYAPQRTTLSPIEQTEFKLQQVALRRDLEEKPSVTLLKPQLDQSVIQTFTLRRTHRSFDPETISFRQLSRFLSSLQSVKLNGLVLPKYRYPSAGGLYPIQTYLYAKSNRLENVSEGIYYYHPAEHRLSLIAEAALHSDIHVSQNIPIFEESAFSIFFIGYLPAVQPLYGELARDFCLLEAGAISQLLMVQASTCDIGLCPVGDLDATQIKGPFGLDETHLYLHSMLGGRTRHDRRNGSSSFQESCVPSRVISSSGVQANNGDAALIGELRSFLTDKLPAYMLPSAFVVLDDLPLTSTGKIDRQALFALEDGHAVRETAYQAPANELEEILSGIVRETLGVERVGVNDGFFQLGGNSIQLVEIANKASQVLRRELSVIELFSHPTVTSLAQFVISGEAEEASLHRSVSRAGMRESFIARRRELRKP